MDSAGSAGWKIWSFKIIIRIIVSSHIIILMILSMIHHWPLPCPIFLWLVPRRSTFVGHGSASPTELYSHIHITKHHTIDMSPLKTVPTKETNNKNLTHKHPKNENCHLSTWLLPFNYTLFQIFQCSSQVLWQDEFGESRALRMSHVLKGSDWCVPRWYGR